MTTHMVETRTKDTVVEEKAGKPKVGIPCEVYSRIVGYLRPIQNWNEGKQQEFKERETFRVKEVEREA